MLMKMKPGPELDYQITLAMINGTNEQAEILAYSTDPLAALKLWEFASGFSSVMIVKK